MIPGFAIINMSSAPAGDLSLIADAMEVYLRDVALDWGRVAPFVKLMPAGEQMPPPGYTPAFVFDRAGATELGLLAYHDVDGSGVPYIRAFLSAIPGQVTLRDPSGRGASLACALLHDAAETLIDPTASLWQDATFTDPQTGASYDQVALEVCDPVQEVTYSFRNPAGAIIDCPNYLLPSYFMPHLTVKPLDKMGMLARPMTLAAGGYVIARHADDATYADGARAARRIDHVVPGGSWRTAHRELAAGARSSRRNPR